LRIIVLALLLAPLGKALLDSGAIAHGARPLNELIHRAGFWALVFLGLTLAVTPFRHVGRYGKLIDVRRMLGVGCFCYIAAHLALYVADQDYDLGKVAYEISHRVYLIIGGLGWLGLAVLAATSTDGMMRWLGGPRWRRLHQIIYAIALLGLIHYFQQTKADVTVPTFAAGLFLWLIGYRLVAWRLSTPDLSIPALLLLSIAVSAITFIGEAVGIAVAFRVSPLRVLQVAFDFSAGIRPGWQVLAAGLAVVGLDLVRSRGGIRSARRTRAVAAE
jgi:sulfoxide reductase heme-binding subunit YedZ